TTSQTQPTSQSTSPSPVPHHADSPHPRASLSPALYLTMPHHQTSKLDATAPSCLAESRTVPHHAAPPDVQT
ncbi:hypothetical protein PanWU01x14_125190, partial [Parasponia andersonii]